MKKTSSALLLTLFAFVAFGQSTQYSEESLRKFFIDHKDSLDQIEGIWDVSTTQENYHFDTLYNVLKNPQPKQIAVIKKDGKYHSFSLSGEPYEVEFNQTDVKGVYLFRNFFADINQYSKPQAVISKSGEMEYTYDFPDDYLRLKLGASYKESTRLVNVMKWKKTFPIN